MTGRFLTSKDPSPNTSMSAVVPIASHEEDRYRDDSPPWTGWNTTMSAVQTSGENRRFTADIVVFRAVGY